MAYHEEEIYTTSDDIEAYELGSRLTLAGIRSHVVDNTRYTSHPTFTVICDDSAKYDASRAVRKTMIGS